MDDAAKAAKRKEIEEKVAAMKLEQKKLEVGDAVFAVPKNPSGDKQPKNPS